MTFFAQTKDVAHIMEVIPNIGWQSTCNRKFTRLFAEWDFTNSPIIASVSVKYGNSGERTKPWCKECVRHVRELADNVLGTMP